MGVRPYVCILLLAGGLLSVEQVSRSGCRSATCPPVHSGILSIVACTEFVFSKWEILRLHILEQGKNGKAVLGEDI